jgi:uncharacterized protein (DUF4415 family)
MNASNTSRPENSETELRRLAAMPDEDIDTSDIPEIRDWSRGERGRFYRPGEKHQIPLYLDHEVLEFLTSRAKRRGIEPQELANEMLKKDIELVHSVE